MTVYDVAPKVEGVSIDADMMLVEGASGSLRVQERYLIRNSSLPGKHLARLWRRPDRAREGTRARDFLAEPDCHAIRKAIYRAAFSPVSAR